MTACRRADFTAQRTGKEGVEARVRAWICCNGLGEVHVVSAYEPADKTGREGAGTASCGPRAEARNAVLGQDGVETATYIGQNADAKLLGISILPDVIGAAC
jgi:hypothetical protein